MRFFKLLRTSSFSKLAVVAVCTFVIFIFGIGIGFADDSEKAGKVVNATLYYSPHCKACIMIKSEFLPGILEKYKDVLVLKQISIEEAEGLKALNDVYLVYGRKKPVVPTIVVNGRLLSGSREIKEGLEDAINTMPNPVQEEQKLSEHFILKKPEGNEPVKKNGADNYLARFSLITILGAGLIDGINPCAFAVIIFFVSFLAAYRFSKGQLIAVGSTYVLAVFVSYVLIGLGLFGFIYQLTVFPILMKAFYILMAVFCLVLAVLSIRDAVVYKKTGQLDEIGLQLPKAFKKRINMVVGGHLRGGSQRPVWALMASTFVVGVMVSVLEAACTGQVYLPTIALVLRSGKDWGRAFLYLLLYNIMFIVPLIFVFLIAYLGVRSNLLQAYLKRNIFTIKLLLAALFIVLAAILLLQ